MKIVKELNPSDKYVAWIDRGWTYAVILEKIDLLETTDNLYNQALKNIPESVQHDERNWFRSDLVSAHFDLAKRVDFPTLYNRAINEICEGGWSFVNTVVQKPKLDAYGKARVSSEWIDGEKIASVQTEDVLITTGIVCNKFGLKPINENKLIENTQSNLGYYAKQLFNISEEDIKKKLYNYLIS